MRVFSLVSLKTRCMQMRHNDQLGPFLVYFGKGFLMFWHMDPHPTDVSKITNRRENFLGSCFVPPKLHGWKYHDGSTHIFRHSRKKSHLKNRALLWRLWSIINGPPNWQTSIHACRRFFLSFWSLEGDRTFVVWWEVSAFPKSHFTSPTLGHY